MLCASKGFPPTVSIESRHDCAGFLDGCPTRKSPNPRLQPCKLGSKTAAPRLRQKSDWAAFSSAKACSIPTFHIHLRPLSEQQRRARSIRSSNHRQVSSHSTSTEIRRTETVADAAWPMAPALARAMFPDVPANTGRSMEIRRNRGVE